MNSISDAEIAEIRARVKRYRPIELDAESRKPLEGQCMRDAVAATLRLPPEQVPLRYEGQHVDTWLAEVGDRFGVRFVPAEADELPPPGSQVWIAIVDGIGEDTHAVPMVGRRPLGVESMLRPRAADGVLTGLLVEYA
jgi:hypothetical protein